MDRKVSLCSDTIFSKPFVVYKIISEAAYTKTLEMCAFLLKCCNITHLYVEDTKLINLDKIIEVHPSYADFFKENYNDLVSKISDFNHETQNSDLCIVLGGDGTTLWASHLYQEQIRPPFLNFNLGTLGYMAIYNYEEYKEVLEELYNTSKTISFERRSLVKGQVFEKMKNTDGSIWNKFLWETNALNDILIEKGDELKMVGLQIFMNEQPLTEVKCDGLIFATATGSTAYSLSAGGSIVHYEVDTLVLNAICPHSLSFRPINFPRDIKLKCIPMQSSDGKAAVTNDGINRVILGKNQFIEVQLSDRKIDFIVLDKFCENRINLWKQKVVQQLGWNNAFKYYQAADISYKNF